MSNFTEALRVSFYMIIYAVIGCGAGTELFAQEIERTDTYIPVTAYEIVSTGSQTLFSEELVERDCGAAKKFAICDEGGNLTLIRFNMCGEFDIRRVPQNERHSISCD
jgi:hypothetical protein